MNYKQVYKNMPIDEYLGLLKKIEKDLLMK